MKRITIIAAMLLSVAAFAQNQTAGGGISEDLLKEISKGYEGTAADKALHNAINADQINVLALQPDNITKTDRHFSHEVATKGRTNQKSSGRCWLFAATNVLREIVAKKNKLDDFELSQSWLAFWDKFERANYFLESILATANLPIDDRVVAYILNTGVGDGGQWDMFVNIINKYGICPKSVYGETAQSSGTGNMNSLLNRALKVDAVALRKMVAKRASAAKIAAAKAEMMSKIYIFLTTCYGKPVEKFDFEYKDKDGKYVIEKGYTPLSFKKKYFGNMLDDYVSIINAPTDDKPFNEVFTVDFLGNVAEAAPIRYLNLSIDDFKALVLKQLQDGEIVWFGSDCGKYSERGEKNLYDPDVYDFESVTGLDLSMTKAEMLDYGFSAMNHAMVITGVNVVNGKPNRWKIENSWGTDGPNKGYFFMSDKWFDSYVFQAVVHKKYLGKKADLLKRKPVVLKPWDPMGTLA